ncbi:MAG: hypothetical protein H0V62_07315 [Gammaproteobacteria bacterium]|nr:hypothetical protein [Gammaproteobacteria bacterium]
MERERVESYVIRIYWREERDPRQVVGIVEHADDGRQQSFSDMRSLWAILTEHPTRYRNTARKRMADPVR